MTLKALLGFGPGFVSTCLMLGCTGSVGLFGGTGDSSGGSVGSGGSDSGGTNSGVGGSSSGGTNSNGSGGNGAGSAMGGTDSGSGGTSGGATGGAAGAGTGDSIPIPPPPCASVGALSSVGVPFDSNTDNLGPNSHAAIYGGSPNIVGRAREDGSFDVAWLDMSAENEAQRDLWVTHVAWEGGTYAAKWHLPVAGLGLLGGFSLIENDYLLLTALPENISDSVEPQELHRDGILQIVRIDLQCSEAFRVEVRADYDGNTDRMPVYQPLVAGSSRLAVSGDAYAIHFSQHTEYDSNPDIQTRHQTGRFFVGSALTGVPSGVAGGISHSFDQRLIPADGGFVAAELGDASHRGIAITSLDATSADLERRTAFAIKGGDGATGGGYNNTFTRLGQLSAAPSGYVLLFASEDETDYTGGRVNASRNVALVHVQSDFASTETSAEYDTVAVDTDTGNSMTDSFSVPIRDYWGSEYNPTNRGIAWLTNYANPSTDHAERPKLVRITEDRFVVLWERWSLEEYQETVAAVVDEWGNLIVAAKTLGQARLQRGDDAFALSGNAAWVTGSAGKLVLHTVSGNLEYQSYELD